MSDPLVALDRVAKRFGSRPIFQDVSLQVRAGEAIGVAGPNGAGKTTLLRLMLGLSRPSAGTVRIRGLRLQDGGLAKLAVAYFGGWPTLPPMARAAGWARAVSGRPVSRTPHRPFSRLSPGVRQMVGLRSILSRPADLIVLDEPWDALDPDGCRWLSGIIKERHQAGSSVVLASHRLAEMADTCSRVVMLIGGSIQELARHGCPVNPLSADALRAAYDSRRHER